jgi:hypothetical protein
LTDEAILSAGNTDTPMADRKVPTHRVLTTLNEDLIKAEIIDEIRKMRITMEHLTFLMQKFQV